MLVLDVKFLLCFFENISKTYNENNKHINLKRFNEASINNSILCITNCLESDSTLSDRLISTDIIMDLLYLARDGHSTEMRKTCGILLAKLAKSNEKLV